MSVRITCINKDNGNHNNPHEAITNFGWLNESNNENGNAPMNEMVQYLEKGNNAYVKDYYGNVAYCIVRISQNGNKFIQTIKDQTYADNLLNLPECR